MEVEGPRGPLEDCNFLVAMPSTSMLGAGECMIFNYLVFLECSTQVGFLVSGEHGKPSGKPYSSPYRPLCTEAANREFGEGEGSKTKNNSSLFFFDLDAF